MNSLLEISPIQVVEEDSLSSQSDLFTKFIPSPKSLLKKVPKRSKRLPSLFIGDESYFDFECFEKPVLEIQEVYCTEDLSDTFFLSNTPKKNFQEAKEIELPLQATEESLETQSKLNQELQASKQLIQELLREKKHFQDKLSAVKEIESLLGSELSVNSIQNLKKSSEKAEFLENELNLAKEANIESKIKLEELRWELDIQETSCKNLKTHNQKLQCEVDTKDWEIQKLNEKIKNFELELEATKTQNQELEALTQDLQYQVLKLQPKKAPKVSSQSYQTKMNQLKNSLISKLHQV